MLIGKNPLNEAPEWFVKNITNRPEECSVLINGSNIKYYIWGDKSKKPLLLLHGYNAHSFWWDHIAPSLTNDHCVVALRLFWNGRERSKGRILSRNICR